MEAVSPHPWRRGRPRTPAGVSAVHAALRAASCPSRCLPPGPGAVHASRSLSCVGPSRGAWALPVLPGALCLTVLPRTSPRLVGVKRCGVLSPRAGGPVCPAVARAAGPGASPGAPLLLPAVCERVPRGAARGRGCARRVSPRGASRAARGCGSSRVSLRVCSRAARAWAQLAALTVPRAQSARSRHSPRLSPRAVLR